MRDGACSKKARRLSSWVSASRSRSCFRITNISRTLTASSTAMNHRLSSRLTASISSHRGELDSSGSGPSQRNTATIAGRSTEYATNTR